MIIEWQLTCKKKNNNWKYSKYALETWVQSTKASCGNLLIQCGDLSVFE